ncbi:MAG TPA: hypothetical protein VEW07_07935 [Solirubrobacterales bacterium]|nr:hypothetical protein [Solirubrobacterales bacterium]
MSPRDSEDMRNDLLAAKERDLRPLLEESSEILDLDYVQTEAMEDFLNLAWFSGTRSGRDQMNARATEPNPDVEAVLVSHLKSDFKGLMDQSAETLNLTVPRTINMWNYLHDAWMAGNRTCEAEMMALYIETQSDVGEEARKWLEEKDETD